MKTMSNLKVPTCVIAAPLVVGILLVSTGAAEIIEVSLPDLVGSYTCDMSHTATFDLGYSLEAVNGAWIRWSGTLTSGFGCGDGIWLPRDDCFPWDCELISVMAEPDPGFWYAHVGPFDGVFDEITPFEGFLWPGWDFLLDGTGDIRISLAPMIIIGGDMIIPPVATIEDAILVVDADLISAVIQVVVAIEPEVLNPRSRGAWVTGFIELPEGYDPTGIDIATVTLNDSLHAEMHPADVGDHDWDGTPDLMVKFSRPKLIEMLAGAGCTEVWVGGEVEGQAFAGVDTIRVLWTGPQARFQDGASIDSLSAVTSGAQLDKPKSNTTTWGKIKAEWGE